MAFQIFPYREEEPRVGRPPLLRPTVDLRVTQYSNQISVRALVDTGAPFCIFSRAVAEALDVDMGRGRGADREVHILGGAHNARGRNGQSGASAVPGPQLGDRVRLPLRRLELSFAGVLGQEGFLDRWVASFNLYDGYFVIEERDAFVRRLGVDPLEFIQGNLDSEWDRPTKN